MTIASFNALQRIVQAARLLCCQFGSRGDHSARVPVCGAQGRGQHEAALDVLRTLSQAPDELPVPPTGAALLYP